MLPAGNQIGISWLPTDRSSHVKIIFINRFFFPDISATSQMLSDLAFFLAGQGHDITVITSRQLYDAAAAGLPAKETVNGVAIRRVAASTFGRGNLVGRALDYLTFYLSAAVSLWHCVKRETIVVAKTDPPLISIPAALVCKLRGAKLANWLQDLFPEVAEALGTRWVRSPVASFLRGLRNRSLRAAETNIVLGERMASRVEALGIRRESIRIVPNWANGAQIRPIDARSSPIRRDWGLERRFVVSYSGNMGRAHEFDTILRAARLVQAAEAKGADAPAEIRNRTAFLFIGGGAQRESIEREGRELGLTELIFKPYQPREKLADSLGAADVHLASLRPELEGLIVPSKIYGSLAAGRPVVFIGAEDGEIGQLVRRENLGFVAKPGKDAELADVLLKLRDDEPLRVEMGARARRVFEAQFDFAIGARKFGEALAAAAAGR